MYAQKYIINNSVIYEYLIFLQCINLELTIFSYGFYTRTTCCYIDRVQQFCSPNLYFVYFKYSLQPTSYDCSTFLGNSKYFNCLKLHKPSLGTVYPSDMYEITINLNCTKTDFHTFTPPQSRQIYLTGFAPTYNCVSFYGDSVSFNCGASTPKTMQLLH